MSKKTHTWQISPTCIDKIDKGSVHVPPNAPNLRSRQNTRSRKAIDTMAESSKAASQRSVRENIAGVPSNEELPWYVNYLHLVL